jgi:apolipoprotein N-acyltransferase
MKGPIARRSPGDRFLDIGLLAFAALLFAASFPGLIFPDGFPILAYSALIPVFLVVRRATWIWIAVYGLLYGFFAYSLFNFWLAAFHPLTIFIVSGIYMAYFFLLFPLLKLADTVFDDYGYLAQFLLWMGYEYLRTLGFLGYPYGILGYSQYPFIPLIQVASLGGVWAVSALVVFPSCFLGAAFGNGRRGIGRFMKKHLPETIVYAAVFAAALVYGFSSQVDYSASRKWRPALIQQDVDPWKVGVEAYGGYFATLRGLSAKALLEKPDIVIWSETAFVPAIDWHQRYRSDVDSYYLVKGLIDYLSTQSVPFLVGNDDGRLETLEDGTEGRVDYNASILFVGGKPVETYRKIHLVPFTEHFPYRSSLPWAYDALVRADTHFWKAGTVATVFESGGVRFSTPICFEDVFGDLSRTFARNGADVIVNMTNDSWSKSVACEKQHATIAIFRAVENRRSLVRATNGGITCAVDPNGRVIAQLPPFVGTYLVPSIPVYRGPETPYTRWGDFVGVFFAWSAALVLAAGIVRASVRKIAAVRFPGAKSQD